MRMRMKTMSTRKKSHMRRWRRRMTASLACA